MRYLLSALGILTLLTLTRAQPQAAFAAGDSFIYVSAREYDALAWMRGKDRFSRGAKLFINDVNGHRVLLSDFAASADPALSFDARRLLFAGKKTSRDRWQIWEMNLASATVHLLTSCVGNCIRPFYLPEDRFVFAEQLHETTAIKVAPLTGGETQQLTYGPGNSLPSDVLRDGRILFDTVFPAGGAEIYTVYSDGSGVESYRCDHGLSRHGGRQLASGDIVFAHDLGLARFTSALAHEVAIPVPSGHFAGDIAELANGEWLFATRSTPKERFQISRYQPGTSAMQTVLADQHADLVEPTLLVPHPLPNRHPSALHGWNYANLLCLNAYTSKLQISAQTISSVRLYTRDASGRAVLLGKSTVEKDGSFYLRTPADSPLKIELLDAAGKSIQKEAGWFWMRRGEQRICVGCHAGPETAPENAVPAVLLRSTVAADMTSAAMHTASGGH